MDIPIYCESCPTSAFGVVMRLAVDLDMIADDSIQRSGQRCLKSITIRCKLVIPEGQCLASCVKALDCKANREVNKQTLNAGMSLTVITMTGRARYKRV